MTNESMIIILHYTDRLESIFNASGIETKADPDNVLVYVDNGTIRDVYQYTKLNLLRIEFLFTDTNIH